MTASSMVTSTSTSTIDQLAIRSCGNFTGNGTATATKFIQVFADCKDCGKKGVICGCINNHTHRHGTMQQQPQQHLQHSNNTMIALSDNDFHQNHLSRSDNDLIYRQCRNEPKLTKDWLQCPECDEYTTEIKTGSCFEHDGRIYCHYHYSLKTETHCASCNMAILNEFVRHPNEQKRTKWHPTCYMIQKSWNIELKEICPVDEDVFITMEPDALEQLQTTTETKIERIWTVLSAFEESAATCISDMLLHFAAGARIECLQMMSQFVYHVQVLFSALDLVVDAMAPEQILYAPEIMSICDQMVRLLHLLADQQQQQHGTAMATATLRRNQATVAHQVLELVTGVAQNLKALIRTGLVHSLDLVQSNHSTGPIDKFLEALLPLEKKRMWAAGRYWFKSESSISGGVHDHLASEQTIVAVDPCYSCKTSIEDSEYLKQENLRWHRACFVCSGCHRTLVDHLGDARLMEYRSNSNPKDTNRFWKLACTDCYSQYNKSNNAFKQKEKRHPFARASRFEQHLDLVRTSLAHYFNLPSVNIPGGEETSSSPNTKRRYSSVLRFLDHRSPLEQLLEQRQKSNNSLAVKRSTTLLDKSAISRFGSLRRALSKTEKRRSCPVPSQSTATTIITTTCESNRMLFMVDLIDSTCDTLIRYFAVVTLANSTPCIISLDEAIGLVDTDHPHPKRSFWAKLKKRISIHHEQQRQHGEVDMIAAGLDGKTPMRTFGVPLAVAVGVGSTGSIVPITGMAPSRVMMRYLSDASSLVPSFMKHCISTMLNCDMSIEGVFRKNGNIRDLNATCEAINREPLLCKSHLEGLSSIQLAALLKRYLHELPEPLLTYKLYNLWITASKSPDVTRAKSILHLACCMLPKPNRDTFQLLCLFLKWVASFQASSKMDIKNLARVIAPTILYTPTTPSRDLIEMFARDEIKVVELLILYQDELLMVPPAFSSLINDPRAAEIITTASNTRQSVKNLHQYMLAHTLPLP